jgi:hypothetical protein
LLVLISGLYIITPYVEVVASLLGRYRTFAGGRVSFVTCLGLLFLYMIELYLRLSCIQMLKDRVVWVP